MDLGLKGRVALITGAAQGIGKATAMALAAEECNLAICDINAEALEKTASELKEKGVQVLAEKVDVTKLAETDAFVAQVAKEFGRIDILVNNAGTGRMSDPMELPEEEFRRNIDLMLFAVIRLSRAVVPYMQKAKWGRIINVSSMFGKQPGGLLDYDTIKAAVNMITKEFANYLAKDNILVNAVCPGPIRTPLWEAPGQLGDQLSKILGKPKEEAIEFYASSNIPLGRYGQPEEIANVIAFLASEKASYITGQAINIDGGMVKAII
ncbi:3-oxoacyl-[acyl-carrier protein] reductase [Caldanaerobius fijiensis DSM 17918]|uniref:3-oxoacyl-[acyl-carrier protein] reductase n=1 Tax=Caldanaerobius fijiensis DSM 17918 TaxID=1121256 RepID=A0A1M4SN39_9THEO|nr:SDR family oxidoreductase [Caldanaerobius fijiensis]SHE33589.1 3-oxoacyl-[acyl-carrier protein] reductase [Caldanaerobius fijiensis DSM 17918]